ncbi:MAG: hypothetical protein OEV28_13230, partial [Nitrospirota bacterium]|nr:hypothetical protein [Nitrospirota bacterium]
FMMTPGGIGPGGTFDGNVWHAINNHLWSPMNLHRIVANVAYGGSIVGAYAAYKFLGASSSEERAHYDWMGYTASVISVGALLPLPFAGYWLTAEIYSYSQQMGISLMGGGFGSLFIIQAVVIGALFLAANYYLWCAIQRTEVGRRYAPYVKYIGAALALCFMVWSTPHTPYMTGLEVKAVGGRFHPLIAPLGLMPAKNIAVNVMIIATFLSFLLYRRSNYPPGVFDGELMALKRGRASAIQGAIITAGLLNIIGLGIYYGYFTNTVYKVASSVSQVLTTLIVIIACLVVEKIFYKIEQGAAQTMPERGAMPEAGQYALILIAVSFTWLMGLMGFVRAAIRGNWHVYSVLKDASNDAFTPAIAYASRVTSVGTVIFMAFIAFIFYLSKKRKI